MTPYQTTPEERAELARMEAEATPGPWVQWVDSPHVYRGPVDVNEPGYLRGGKGRICEADATESALYEDGYEDAAEEQAERDAALIAASRNALPRLLADLETALAMLAAVREIAVDNVDLGAHGWNQIMEVLDRG